MQGVSGSLRWGGHPARTQSGRAPRRHCRQRWSSCAIHVLWGILSHTLDSSARKLASVRGVRAAHLHCAAAAARKLHQQWAVRAAEAASTRGGATARRPAACCPSRLYWVIGTGTTTARTGTTASSSDCGASPSTRTATLLSCSSRTTDGEGSRLRSRLYSRRCRRPKTTAGRLAASARRSGATCVLDRKLCARFWCWRTR